MSFDEWFSTYKLSGEHGARMIASDAWNAGAAGRDPKTCDHEFEEICIYCGKSIHEHLRDGE
jgi:hypothetical protein